MIKTKCNYIITSNYTSLYPVCCPDPWIPRWILNPILGYLHSDLTQLYPVWRVYFLVEYTFTGV